MKRRIKDGSGLINIKDVCRLPTSKGDTAAGEEDSDEPIDKPGHFHRPAQQTYEQVLGGVISEHPDAVTLVQNPNKPGDFYRCVRADRLPELLQEAGQEAAAKAVTKDIEVKPAKRDPSEERRQLEHLAEIKTRREAIARVGNYIKNRLSSGGDLVAPGPRQRELKVLFQWIVNMKWSRNNSDAAKRRGFGDKGPRPTGFSIGKLTLDKRLEELSAPDLIAFLVELLLEVEGSYNTTTQLMAIFDVTPQLNYKELKAENLKDLKAKKKEKTAKAKKTAAKKDKK